MVVPAAGAKSSGFLGETAPPYKNYRFVFYINIPVFGLKYYRHCPQTQFLFSMLKFATRRVCGYLHGPCGFVTTGRAAD
jgi:hypothetical protein